MIEETAQIMACEGRFAWVETRRAGSCGSCAARQGCGTAVLARVLGQRRSRTRVLNEVQARVGDEVVIGLQEHALVRGALAIYLVPLLGLLGGALLGGYLAERLLADHPDLFSIVLGGIGLAAGGLWLRYYARRIRTDARYQPVILRRLSGAAPLVPQLGGYADRG